MTAPKVVKAGSLRDNGGAREQEQHPPHPHGPLGRTRDEEQHDRLDHHEHEIRHHEDVVQRRAGEAPALQKRKEVRQDESDSEYGQPHLYRSVHFHGDVDGDGDGDAVILNKT